MKNQNLIIIAVAALIVGGGVGFFGGVEFQKNKTSSPGMTQLGPNGALQGRTPGQGGNSRFGATNGAARGGAVTGEILSASDNSITVKLADGSSKIILLTQTTTVNKSESGSKSDLTTGTKVAIFGVSNSDGSVTAQSVQINPTGGLGMRMGNDVPKNSGTKSADATELNVSGKNYSFTPNALTIPVGQKTRIVFKSTDGFHDFKVDELNIKTAVVQTGDSDWVEFTPTKAGTYKFYCSVGDHRAMGMEGTLIVQ